MTHETENAKARVSRDAVGASSPTAFEPEYASSSKKFRLFFRTRHPSSSGSDLGNVVVLAELGEVLVEVLHLVAVRLARHGANQLFLGLRSLLVEPPLRRRARVRRGRRDGPALGDRGVQRLGVSLFLRRWRTREGAKSDLVVRVRGEKRGKCDGARRGRGGTGRLHVHPSAYPSSSSSSSRLQRRGPRP